MNEQINHTLENLRTYRWRYTFLGVAAIFLLFGIFWLARHITSDTYAQELVQDFGYLGVLVVSFIAGLNAIVPVPAGSFVPIFTAAGLALPYIIIALVVGTMLADLLAWYVGVFSRKAALANYPRLSAFAFKLRGQREWYVIAFVFIYATIAPIPNEVILVPLALAGVRLRILFLPLLFGTILYQTVFAYSTQNLFEWLF